MTHNCRIPDKTEKISLTIGEISFIDTKGLGCILKAGNKALYILAKTSDSTENAFPLEAGESVELCGTFGVFAKEEAECYAMYYITL